ncbi:hypothetical protein BB559_001363 [Furculomyces boomerangus]|uniref:Enoyl reductase (ER) domain-containing protein n=2 Tax=Harpellales TaxID=61421 RepID=A0A2T9Z2A1_9FUNG|nr:hypothetical protein BB559_001363 [Furculomyces boomerangus]PWA02141.1 hypothetical protein BB558_001736 [Smittium angustum]
MTTDNTISYEGKTITCKAAVAWEAGKPMSIEDVEVAPPKANEVRIKITHSSICHSDSHVLAGNTPNTKFPIILGHESAGIVESVGEGVTAFSPGDHVIPLFLPDCGKCMFCKSGKTNLCLGLTSTWGRGLMEDGTTRFTCKGQEIYHFMGVSTFSQYSVVSAYSVTKVDHEAPLDRVCLLGCCIPTGVGAVQNTAKVFKGATVAVFGCGALGLSVIQGAKMAEAGEIIALDINPGKFDKAREFGATRVMNPLDYKEKIEDVLKREYNGGVDFSFDTSGGNVGVMNSAFECTTNGWGLSVVISVAKAGDTVSTIPFNMIRGKSWTGCFYGGVKGSDLGEYVKNYMEGKLMIDEYVTRNITLDTINEGFDDLHAGKCIRQIIPMHE